MDPTSENLQTVTIPIPLPFQRDYGVHARTEGKHGTERLMQRYNGAENAMIERQAARLGVTVSAFIRESAVNMAKALEQQEKKNAQHNLRSG